MLQIITDGYDSPNGTYFGISETQPKLEQDQQQGQQVLKLVNGNGTHRSWGEPSVISSVLLETEDLVAIHVGFHHKYRGGQFYRYYRLDGQQWHQVRWAQLSDEDRQRVLIAREDRAPSWANVPGMLRTDYKIPVIEIRTSYKLVQVIDGRYYSVYNGTTEYAFGKRLAERAMSEHGGGYYSYPDAEEAEQRFHAGNLFPPRCYQHSMTVALIECEISGRMITYDNGKYSSTYLRPLKELKRFEYIPTLQEIS